MHPTTLHLSTFQKFPQQILHIFTCSRIKKVLAAASTHYFNYPDPPLVKNFDYNIPPSTCTGMWLLKRSTHLLVQSRFALPPGHLVRSSCRNDWKMSSTKLCSFFELQNKKLLWVLQLSNYHYDVAADTEWTNIVQIHNEGYVGAHRQCMMQWFQGFIYIWVFCNNNL